MLSKRLKEIAKLVKRNKVVFDVGSDHALLPCFLVLNDICFKAYAADINEGPLNHGIENIKRYHLEDKVAIIVVSKKDLEECEATDNMTEGFIDFPLTVRTVEVAISLLEIKKNTYKISFRSKGKVDVNEIASLYGGGGHILASGAMLNGYKEDIIDKLVYNVSQRLE